MAGALIRAWLVALAVAVAAVAVSRAPSSPARASSVAPGGWDEPALQAPQSIELSDSNRNLKLDRGSDYTLTCPNRAVTLSWTLVVYGGRNVVFQDCRVVNADPGAVDSQGRVNYSGAVQFKNQAAGLWVHDVYFAGAHLSEGIDLHEPDAGVTTTFRDVLLDPVRMNPNGGHDDVIQTDCGPANLLVDGLTASSDYQGLFLLPNQNGGCAGTTPARYEFDHVDIAGIVTSRNPANLGWVGWFGADGHANVDWRLEHVYFSGESPVQLYPNARQWQDVIEGAPPRGAFVIPSSWGATGPDEPCGGAGCSDQRGAYGAGESPPR